MRARASKRATKVAMPLAPRSPWSRSSTLWHGADEPPVPHATTRTRARRTSAVRPGWRQFRRSIRWILSVPALNEILAEFESHWIGREVEGAQYLPAEAAFFRDVVSGVVREQRELDPLIDEALSKSWPLKRIETVLRAALRAGAYELIHRGDVPARVVVAEYADVVAAFVERDETGMVNAVLDQLARRLRAAEFGRAPGEMMAARTTKCRPKIA